MIVIDDSGDRKDGTATAHVGRQWPGRLGKTDNGTGPHPSADLVEIVRLYGLWSWIEQSYKQIKDELGRADFQVRSARAIHRHQTLVNCAFSFCWDQWFAPPGPLDATAPDPCPNQGSERGTKPVKPAPTTLLPQDLTSHPFLAHPRHHPQSMAAGLDGHGPALRTPGPDRRRHHRARH
ncbi:transposase [Streptomyces rhizosphaerihabitans]|uniref:transposase n=1 Tax=Streptomyces rhizosphaerihabitans TaxID=1266770 RepID=UPI0021C03912|nr:transposase [Streptomyces rhizosphaerihabitans]MCT9004606.1 transposase [Streptomyces rhizosphaerihabitans]